MITNIQELFNKMTPDVYQQLKQAVEIGKWPTGDIIEKEQLELCIQAVIAYEEKHYSPEEKVGYIPPRDHPHCGSTAGKIADDQDKPIKFK